MSYVTGISGNVISAASAGYAPTNSADVSAIASAYQVVSSTSTELYAGTAFLTGVNDAPVSASRAGNAANAGMANSAYYDGTGRLISSLPDSAAVSSIASSYAESAASGKLDSSASSSFYTTANESGYVDSSYVDGAVSGKADSSAFMVMSYGDTPLVTLLSGSGFYAQQAYRTHMAGVDDNGRTLTALAAESSLSSKQDASAMSAYALSSNVSGVIDTVSANSASWGGGATGDYVEKSAMEVAIGSGNTVSSTAFAQGADNVASGDSVAFGVNNVATGSSIAVGDACSSISKALAVGQRCTAWSDALAVGYRDHATNQGLAVGDRCSASENALALGYYASAYANAVAAGEFCSAKNTAVAFGKYNLHVDGNTSTGDSAAFVIGDGTASTARHDLMLVTKDGEITMYSSTADAVGTGIMSSIRAISAAATGGGVDSATVSAIASSYVESGVSSKLDTTAFNSGDFYSTSNPSGFITGVDLSDYATTAYVDSSVSGKLDTTAYNSGDFYTTANESGYVGSAYVDSAVSGKMDSSAMTSYALSADVSGTVDLVSTQSANWGGSSLALSAGPGVKLEKVGNTLVVSNDETVLFSGESFSATLSESIKNFSRMYLEYGPTNYYSAPLAWYSTEAFSANDVFRGVHLEFVEHNGSNAYCFPKNTTFIWDVGFTSLNATGGLQYRVSGNAIQNELTGNQLYIRKIVGINRTAGV